MPRDGLVYVQSKGVQHYMVTAQSSLRLSMSENCKGTTKFSPPQPVNREDLGS